MQLAKVTISTDLFWRHLACDQIPLQILGIYLFVGLLLEYMVQFARAENVKNIY